jgi:hypothetical protein
VIGVVVESMVVVWCGVEWTAQTDLATRSGGGEGLLIAIWWATIVGFEIRLMRYKGRVGNTDDARTHCSSSRPCYAHFDSAWPAQRHASVVVDQIPRSDSLLPVPV